MSKQTKIHNFDGFHVLIPAAGNGLRTGCDIPKQYMTVGGKTILRHTIEKFIGLKGLKSLRVIIGSGHEGLYQEAVHNLNLQSPIIGADTRKQSVYHGLCSYKGNEQNDIILIHDAARPFVTHPSIRDILNAMQQGEDCATLSYPSSDTLVYNDYKIIDRNTIHTIQTPQAFRIGQLKSAHEKFMNDNNFTDDCGIMAAMGHKVELVNSPKSNFKITTKEDTIMAEKLLSTPTQTRVGFGYDVHAFDPNPSTYIRLGGVDIPYHKKLLGHSDADVALHALTDAMLGTIGDGDIGHIFPPSDNKWKDADSKIFVAEALRRVHEKGGNIVNADITLIAEEPKIGPYRETMKNTVADMLSISSSRIGLKATTSEGLGFVGEKHGIEAKVVVSIEYPKDME